MPDAKHTKGPWRANRAFSRDPYVTSDSGLVASALVGYAAHISEAEANARLIAAAPDMLALLEKLIDIEGPQPGHGAWYAEVQAVIAKAKGGTDA